MQRTQLIRIRPLAILVAWVMAHFLGGFILGYLENNGGQFVATLFLSGAIIGSLQWAVLRGIGNRGRRWYLWPVVSCLGWLVGTLLVVSLTLPVNYGVIELWRRFGLWEVFWLNVLNQPLWITVMAIAQGSMLSFSTPCRWRTIGYWLLASGLGAALNGAVGATLCRAYCQVWPQAAVGIVPGLGWATYAAVTGIALCRLLQRRKAE